MNNQPLFSILIPTYNSGGLLYRSVESAFRFSDQPTEVIVIDDGSTDLTPSIINELLERFPDLKSYSKKNGGLSSARNFGIDRSIGKYIVLLDSDDELLPVTDTSSFSGENDIVRIGVEEISVDGAVKHHTASRVTMTGPSMLAQAFSEQSFYTPSWAYIYRRQWLNDNGLRFLNGLIHEDMLFTVEALLKCEIYSVIEDTGYRYHRSEGTITINSDPDKLAKRIRGLSTVVERLIFHANQNTNVDIGWRILSIINYANKLSTKAQRRSLHWMVLLMELRFFFFYKPWGRFRTRRHVRYRIRQALQNLLSPK